ncbi:MAG: hypothetical protein AAGC46_13715 [Solirubrobacteraceae bacterium]|nr:hypothetical protein [Patulibacter sp.]
MQLTVADPAVDHVDLVLEAWSAAPAPAEPVSLAVMANVDADLDSVDEQLTLRLEQSQIPLWDARA